MDSRSLDSLDGETQAAIRAMSDAMAVARSLQGRAAASVKPDRWPVAKEHEIGRSSTLHPHHDQLGLTISGDVSFTNHSLDGDPGGRLHFDEHLGVGDELIAIRGCQHNRLKTTGPGP